VKAPLVDGCVGWLECRVIDRSLAERFDLFVVEVEAAWVDDAVFKDGEWTFHDDSRATFHHMSAGKFFLTGAPRTAVSSRR
jgi:flavin reductase (DIM6/NTAB) family NADH-FMN oxidoreductase RutF